MDAIMRQPLQRRQGQALVDSWDCLRAYVASYEERCGALSQYGAQHTRTFANLCNARLDAATWHAALGPVCDAQAMQAQ